MNASIICWAIISALALPQLAHAQIYKWVDENGVTTYGNKPPPSAAGLTRLTDGGSRLSVIPSARAEPAYAARERALESRIARVERDRGPLPSGVDRATVATLGTFETVEDVHDSARPHFERAGVVVAADLALCHGRPFSPMDAALGCNARARAGPALWYATCRGRRLRRRNGPARGETL